MSPTATWPDRAQYQDSVEAPQHSFDDPELRGATFARGNWGLMAWSGARAIVFRAVDDSGKSTAVRFLLNRDPEAGVRYETLARHLRRATRIPAPAPKRRGSPDGLKIAGSRYPLLKMEWVDWHPDGPDTSPTALRHANRGGFDLAGNGAGLGAQLRPSRGIFRREPRGRRIAGKYPGGAGRRRAGLSCVRLRRLRQRLGPRPERTLQKREIGNAAPSNILGARELSTSGRSRRACRTH